MFNNFRVIFLSLALVFAWTNTYAVPINVGTIKIDKYETTLGGGVGGINIIAHYTLNDNFVDQDCCEEGDIRWLQRVTSSKPTGFTPPDPNRPFIDPRTDQSNGWDNLPWYDATFNSLQDAKNNQNRQFGSGPYFMDQPRVLLERGPYSFFAETLLVCIEEITKKIINLGGFSWGFDIGADKATVTSKPITQLNDNVALRNSFNTALGLDYPGWSLVAASDVCTSCPYVTVPEPSSLILSILGLLIFAVIHDKKRSI